MLLTALQPAPPTPKTTIRGRSSGGVLGMESLRDIMASLVSLSVRPLLGRRAAKGRSWILG